MKPNLEITVPETADEFIIEHGVPIPEGRMRYVGFTAALRKCEVGDSFVVPFIATGSRTSIYTCATHLGMRVVMRKQDNGSYRIWRTK